MVSPLWSTVIFYVIEGGADGAGVASVGNVQHPNRHGSKDDKVNEMSEYAITTKRVFLGYSLCKVAERQGHGKTECTHNEASHNVAKFRGRGGGALFFLLL